MTVLVSGDVTEIDLVLNGKEDGLLRRNCKGGDDSFWQFSQRTELALQIQTEVELIHRAGDRVQQEQRFQWSVGQLNL